MKRRIRLLPVLLAVFLAFPAWAEESTAQVPRYEARTRTEIYLQTAPGGGDTVDSVAENARVKVLEMNETWCLVQYGSRTGYCRTGSLWGFRSLDAARYPVPGCRPACGVLTTLEPVLVNSPDFSGVTVRAGTLLCPVSAEEGAYTLPVWRSEAAFPAALFAYTPFVPFGDAEPGDVIGGYTTYYDEKYGGLLAESRQHNIALGCERINGAVTLPGGEFSFNAVCGPFSQNSGYQIAPNIGESGKGYGGGVCQVSTTLYNALLGTPLQITAWAVHRFSGVQYARQFFDAAVGAYSDLKFQNTLPYPVRLEAMPQGGAVTVLLYRAE